MREVLVIFSSDNAHPLAWLLDRHVRHVFVLVRDRNNFWVKYDWAQGLPEIDTEAPGDFNIVEHYEDAGYHVIPHMIPEDAKVLSTFVLNNCVGHVKVICGIRSAFVFTPYKLFVHLTEGSVMTRLAKWFKNLSVFTFLPGFGGAKSPPPPPVVEPPPSPPKATDPAVKRAKIGERTRQATAAGRKRNIRSGQIIDDPEQQTRKTLLGV